jgi:hypothetical protein
VFDHANLPLAVVEYLWVRLVKYTFLHVVIIRYILLKGPVVTGSAADNAWAEVKRIRRNELLRYFI